MGKLFMIEQEDLQKLEYALPVLQKRLGPMANDPEVQVLFDECNEILSNMRQRYGLPDCEE